MRSIFFRRVLIINLRNPLRRRTIFISILLIFYIVSVISFISLLILIDLPLSSLLIFIVIFSHIFIRPQSLSLLSNSIGIIRTKYHSISCVFCYMLHIPSLIFNNISCILYLIFHCIFCIYCLVCHNICCLFYFMHNCILYNFNRLHHIIFDLRSCMFYGSHELKILFPHNCSGSLFSVIFHLFFSFVGLLL